MKDDPDTLFVSEKRWEEMLQEKPEETRSKPQRR